MTDRTTHWIRLTAAFWLLSGLWCGLFAQKPEPAETDDAALDALGAEVKQARTKAIQAALLTLDKAAASPKAAEDFFFDCVKQFDFKRDLEEPGKFDEWRRAFLEQWRGHDLGLVLQLQLRHQAMVLRSAAAEDKAALVPQWLTFIESMVDHAADASFGAAFLAQPINTSVFDKALRLRQLGGGLASFGSGPLDIGGMFATHIRPHVRPESRASAWQRRIELQTKFAKETFLPTEFEDFETFELPRLRWEQLMDVHFFDDAQGDASGYEVAVSYVRKNMQHPDATKWVDKLKMLRKKPESSKNKPAVDEVAR
jgi:hypothetical protein